VSAATGIALALAVVRAFASKGTADLGNFWTDLTRIVLYVFLPVCLVMALAFVALGVPQTLQASASATTLEGAQQTLGMGPVASQLAIKQLGTNGGGFFNVNSSHPFENPNAWTNLISIWAILALAFALPLLFGRMVGDQRQGQALFAAMGAILILGGLQFFPALALGPIVKHLLMQAGVTF
jgi:K+-transporting ATPase ATPase A chain